MASPSVRRLTGSWPGSFPTVVVLATCSLALTACGAAGAGAALPKTPSPEPVSTRTSTGTLSGSTSSTIVSAWVAAEQAFDDAARSADADDPELAATTIDPQLTWTEGLLTRMQQDGQLAVGQNHFGHPRVLSEQGPLATVEACSHDAEIVVRATTGTPVPGGPGQVDDDRFISTMELTGAGWKLADQTVEADQCHP